MIIDINLILLILMIIIVIVCYCILKLNNEIRSNELYKFLLISVRNEINIASFQSLSYYIT